ncbi:MULTISPECIES: hypothetical protein [unclassified Bartonella]|uniref:hypothetical protein n=2 Tax=Bartonella TaxID=773 RepID=UPI0035CED8D3
MSQSLQEQMTKPIAQSASSMRQMQKDFQKNILQTSNTATNNPISAQMTKEKCSDHQERTKQPPKKATAYWDTGTKKRTPSLSPYKKNYPHRLKPKKIRQCTVISFALIVSL